jgi:hypothetical protein
MIQMIMKFTKGPTDKTRDRLHGLGRRRGLRAPPADACLRHRACRPGSRAAQARCASPSSAAQQARAAQPRVAHDPQAGVVLVVHDRDVGAQPLGDGRDGIAVADHQHDAAAVLPLEAPGEAPGLSRGHDARARCRSPRDRRGGLPRALRLADVNRREAGPSSISASRPARALAFLRQARVPRIRQLLGMPDQHDRGGAPGRPPATPRAAR